MEINNKSKRSIYLYDPSAAVEKGDWIVKGDNLYIALADCVGKDPEIERTFYKLYLSENTGTLEDLIAYSKDILTEDKFVNVYGLGEIFNAYMIGYNERGVITSDIGDNGEIFVSDYFGDEININPNPSYTDPLDKIMTSLELNNAIFTVSRSVVTGILGTTTANTNKVILRQYTYKDDDTTYIRVQELIDEGTGLIRFRYALSSNSFEPSGAWTSTTVNSSFRSIVDNVINYYNNKVTEMEKEKVANKATFRFKNVTLPVSYNPSSISTANNNLSVPIDNFNWTEREDMFITITTAYLEQSDAAGVLTGNNNVYRTDSITVNLGDFLNSPRTSESYNIVGTKLLVLKKNVADHVDFLTNEGSWITNIYTRQSFRDYTGTEDSEIFYTLVPNKQEAGPGSTIKYIFNRDDIKTDKGKVISLDNAGYLTFRVVPSYFDGQGWKDDTIGTRIYKVKISDLRPGLNYFESYDADNRTRIVVAPETNTISVSTYLTNENGVRDIGISADGRHVADPKTAQKITVKYSI